MPPESNKIAYRPDIDGLRAIAVLGVVFFHAGLSFPGGYVGVDVFFVISGFLITSLLLKELRQGTFSLLNFWERRIRRILPALIVMVLVTLLVGGLLLLPGDYERLGKSVIAQALLAANLYFWRDDTNQGGYFGPTSEERPLLHTWSLSVEEQFYLFFPLMLVFLFRFERFRKSRTLSLMLFTGLLAGLALAVCGVKFRPGATFYLLPTRAWELLCGAWIASLSSASIPQNRLLREGVSWLGIAGLLLPCWLYTKETPFPGLAALPPCFGTCLLIWSNARHEDGLGRVTSAGRLLAMRPVVFIGMISYSLYLWHWPVLVFGNYWWPQNWTKPWYLSVGLGLVAGLMSVLSWRYVETPFRRRIIMTTRPGAFRFAAACTLLILLCGIVLIEFRGLPARLPGSAAKNEEAKLDRLDTDDMSPGIEAVRQGHLMSLGVRESAATSKVLLWGDSHARHAVPAMDALCCETGISGWVVTHSLTPPLLNAVFQLGEYGLNEQTPDFSAAVLEQIKRRGITHVVLAASWAAYQTSDSQLLKKALSATIHTLHEAGCRVWVLQDVPNVGLNVPMAMARSVIFGGDTVSWRTLISAHHRANLVLYEMAEGDLPARFIDPAPLLLDSHSDRYRADIDGVSIYFDGNHLTKRASLALLLPLFRAAMSDELAAAQRATGPLNGAVRAK